MSRWLCSWLFSSIDRERSGSSAVVWRKTSALVRQHAAARSTDHSRVPRAKFARRGASRFSLRMNTERYMHVDLNCGFFSLSQTRGTLFSGLFCLDS
ncbi:hypothetical protein BDY21DRAFT_33891 [Lineolata rhizophorae]|uniref:Uncharacterized protein n=1 Tax=Lineolata rhizophorae TaxID=578093 RepID=A0A6A6NZX3_9PEZI|nr:hypothetical protein BDY21DRAFT_33891 [Lineolata rhizophorae]